MMEKQAMQITKDLPNKTITVTRDFAAGRDLVWRTWTEKELLDQWWAPKPYRAVTHSMDFREGGAWLYAMLGPEGDRSHVRVDFGRINKPESFTARDAFADENFKPLSDPPGMDWHNEFRSTGEGTRVVVTITFASEADLKKIVEMGFEEGFGMALGNLDELLAEQ